MCLVRLQIDHFAHHFLNLDALGPTPEQMEKPLGNIDLTHVAGFSGESLY